MGQSEDFCAHTLPLTCHLRCSGPCLHDLTPTISPACTATLPPGPTCPPPPSVSPALQQVVPA